MKLFENNVIEERTISDAWNMALWATIRNGYDYKIESGSYIGQIRKQLENVMIIIDEPWTRPLAPIMPEGLGIPPTTDDDKIQSYFYEYLITDTKEDKEDYTYAQYISKQIDEVIDKLNKSKGNTNQSCMNIGDVESVYLNDPPCLRLIDFKVVDGKLNMTVFFRSWDCYSGFPENLGGLQLLKEYVLMHLNFPVEDGKIIAYSSGLHIYEMYFPVINQLHVNKIKL